MKVRIHEIIDTLEGERVYLGEVLEDFGLTTDDLADNDFEELQNFLFVCINCNFWTSINNKCEYFNESCKQCTDDREGVNLY